MEQEKPLRARVTVRIHFGRRPRFRLLPRRTYTLDAARQRLWNELEHPRTPMSGMLTRARRIGFLAALTGRGAP